MGAFIVDAWIDSVNPSIRLLSRATGALIAEWRDDSVRRLLDEGTVTASELSTSDRSVSQRIAQELLLAACVDSLCAESDHPCFSCVTRRLLQGYHLLQEGQAADLPPHAGLA